MGKGSKLNISFFPFSFIKVCLISLSCSLRILTITFLALIFIYFLYSSLLIDSPFTQGCFMMSFRVMRYLGSGSSIFSMRSALSKNYLWSQEKGLTSYWIYPRTFSFPVWLICCNAHPWCHWTWRAKPSWQVRKGSSLLRKCQSFKLDTNLSLFC